MRFVGVETGLRCDALLPVVVHDGGVQTLHLSLGLCLVVVNDALVEGGGAVDDGADGNGAFVATADFDFLVLPEDLLAPAGDALGRADWRCGTQDGVLGAPGNELELERLGRVLRLPAHSSSYGEEQDAPEQHGADVASDDAADLGRQEAPVPGGVCRSGGPVLRRGCGVAVVIEEIVGAWRRGRMHSRSKQKQECRREVSESPPHCWVYDLSQPEYRTLKAGRRVIAN